MNWYISRLLKEARGRRFNVDDRVRYFTEGLKGRGKGIILTPSFRKGRVVEDDRVARRYRIDGADGIVEVHPRNLIPESLTQSTPGASEPSVVNELVVSEPVGEPAIVEPFVR